MSFPSHAEVQWRAFWTMGYIADNNPVATDWLVSAGAAPAVLAAMRRFPESKAVQDEASGAVLRIAEKSPAGKAALKAGGAVELLRAANRKELCQFYKEAIKALGEAP